MCGECLCWQIKNRKELRLCSFSFSESWETRVFFSECLGFFTFVFVSDKFVPKALFWNKSGMKHIQRGKVRDINSKGGKWGRLLGGNVRPWWLFNAVSVGSKYWVPASWNCCVHFVCCCRWLPLLVPLYSPYSSEGECCGRRICWILEQRNILRITLWVFTFSRTCWVGNKNISSRQRIGMRKQKRPLIKCEHARVEGVGTLDLQSPES